MINEGLVVEFDSPKVVSRIPEQVITTDKIVIREMIDSPVMKTVTIHMDTHPFRMVLWQGAQYDSIGNWTNEDVINRINELCS
jgi:hypothetical protein